MWVRETFYLWIIKKPLKRKKKLWVNRIHFAYVRNILIKVWFVLWSFLLKTHFDHIWNLNHKALVSRKRGRSHANLHISLKKNPKRNNNIKFREGKLHDKNGYIIKKVSSYRILTLNITIINIYKYSSQFITQTRIFWGVKWGTISNRHYLGKCEENQEICSLFIKDGRVLHLAGVKDHEMSLNSTKWKQIHCNYFVYCGKL